MNRRWTDRVVQHPVPSRQARADRVRASWRRGRLDRGRAVVWLRRIYPHLVMDDAGWDRLLTDDGGPRCRTCRGLIAYHPVRAAKGPASATAAYRHIVVGDARRPHHHLAHPED